jgi:endonuclease/exonuclease/phosphatase (EEP) superfamily protein YafD
LRVIFSVAVAVLATVCGVAAVAAQGGRWNNRLDLLTHPAPLWLAGGVACLVLSAFVIRGWPRFVTAAFSLAAVLSAGNLMWTDLARLPAALRATSAPGSLKVIEFNAWSRNPEPQRVGQWLAHQDPDVVIILESTPLIEREVAAQTHLQIFHGSGAIIATREKPLAEHVAWEARHLPGAPTEFTWVDLRGTGGQLFTVAGVHKGRPIPSRYAWGQDRNIAAIVATQDRSSLILAGDFNSTQWSFRQRITDAAIGLERRDIAIPTWPERLADLGGMSFPVPFMSIDHIYAGSSWKMVSVKRGPRLGSDHYPLVATLVWAPAR